MIYDTLEKLNEDFISNTIEVLPESMVVEGKTYIMDEWSTPDMKSSNMLEYVAYILSTDIISMDDKLTEERVVFGWKKKRMKMLPIGVKKVMRNVEENLMERRFDGKDDDKVSIEKDRIIGSTVDVTLVGFNSNFPIRAKCDSGAQVNSLHATNIDIRDATSSGNPDVKFSFHDSSYIMTVHSFMAVQQNDNSVENRPVVKFDMKVNDKLLEGVLCNLHDRGTHDHEMLLGVNGLESGRFIIDVRLDEDVKSELIPLSQLIQEAFVGMEPQELNIPDLSELKRLLTMLK